MRFLRVLNRPCGVSIFPSELRRRNRGLKTRSFPGWASSNRRKSWTLQESRRPMDSRTFWARPVGRSAHAVSYTHLRAHETDSYLVCRLLLEKKKKKNN